MSLEKPRFRRDLEVRPVLTDGQSYVEVRDVAAGKSFLFYDFEYQVALAFDGLPLEKVIPWVKLATGLALQVEQLREFALRLDELGFLERELTLDIEAPGFHESEPSAALSSSSSSLVPAAAVSELVESLSAEAPSASPDQPALAPACEEEVALAPDPLSGAPPVDAVATQSEQRVRNAESIDSGKVVVAEAVAESPSITLAPGNPVDGAKDDRPPREETPGPPDPDSVVMHPSEVVGETPPPMSGASVAAPEPTIGQLVAAADGGPSAGGLPVEAGIGDAATRGEEPVVVAGGEAVVIAAATEIPVDHAGDEAPLGEEAAAASGSLLGDESESVAEAILHKAPPPDPSPTELGDSTVFPVLPVNRPAPAEVVQAAGPPSWTTPRPLTTPRPVTLGPLVDRPSARRRTRRRLVLFGTLGVLAAATLLAVVLPFVFSSRQPGQIRVRTLSVTPGTVYRYFEGAAPIASMPGLVLKFPVGGKVTRIVGKGSLVAAGDVVAAVEAARGLQTQLTHQRERLAYYRQMAEAMHQVGNAKEEERQLSKLEARDAAIAKTLRDLANVAVIASTPGEVDETLVHDGQIVEAGSPAVRLQSPGFRAMFELPRTQATLARRLGFCQVEVDGYLLDCSPAQIAAPEGDIGHVGVDLASVPPALVGKPAHLARARYSSAAVLPVAALQHSGSRVGVFVVSASARLELRPVVVAERDEVEAIVVQGLDVGDRVVVEPASGLRPGMAVGLASGR